MYQHIKVPGTGEKISVNKDFTLNVPANPIIPYIEGDGTGVDITPVMLKVVDSAVEAAYGTKRKIVWMEMFAGEKSCKVYGENVWLPEETLQASKEFVVSIKGPLTTPVGGGIRSINVALRQEFPDQGNGREENPISRHVRHRHQAGFPRRHGTAGAQGNPVRGRQQASFCDPGAQGQYHEVHGRRFPRLGLCAGKARIRRGAD